MMKLYKRLQRRIKLLGFFESLKDCLKKPFRIFSKIVFTPYIHSVNIAGFPLRLGIGNFEAHCWYGNSFWSGTHSLKSEIPWLKSVCHDNMIIADIGAHQGYFSLLASQWIGSEGMVHSFECLPENVDVFRKNIELNLAKNIILIGSAVGACCGSVYIAKDSSGVVSDLSSSVLSVEMVSLDSYFSGKRKPDLIKIDVEGYEYEVLKGARECLSLTKNLDLEFHVFNYKKPYSELSLIFDLLNFKDARVFVELRPGMVLIPYRPEIHTIKKLIQYPNFHLYVSWFK